MMYTFAGLCGDQSLTTRDNIVLADVRNRIFLYFVSATASEKYRWVGEMRRDGIPETMRHIGVDGVERTIYRIRLVRV